MIPFYLFTDVNVKVTVIAKKKSERNDSESFNQGEQVVIFTCLGCEFSSHFVSVWLFQMLK